MITLTRLHKRSDGIFSNLNVEGLTLAALEHAYQQDDGSYDAKIPPGTYLCVRGMHRLSEPAMFETFEITGVPGHTGLLFHCGNFDQDSEGCVLLGDIMDISSKPGRLFNSRNAFSDFMDKLVNLDSFQLSVV